MRLSKNAWPFKEPVDPNQVTDYLVVIKEPMGKKFYLNSDLQTLENNLECGNYKNKDSFVKDLKKIVSNAKKYNEQNTIFFKCAKDFEHTVDDLIQNLREK